MDILGKERDFKVDILGGYGGQIRIVDILGRNGNSISLRYLKLLQWIERMVGHAVKNGMVDKLGSSMVDILELHNIYRDDK